MMGETIQDVIALLVVLGAALYLTQRIVGSRKKKSRGASKATVQVGDRLARGLKSAKKNH
jgi:hypothetical protein